MIGARNANAVLFVVDSYRSFEGRGRCRLCGQLVASRTDWKGELQTRSLSSVSRRGES